MPVLSRLLLLPVVASLAWFPGPAVAIDCSKAAKPAEKTLCAKPELLQLDARLNEVYGRAVAGLSKEQRKPIAQEQREWLERRDACNESVECLAVAMKERIAVLEGRVKAGSEEQHGPFRVRYERARRWDVTVPVIVSGPKSPGVAKINEKLKGLLEEGCVDEGEVSPDWYFNLEVRVAHADDRFFTVQKTLGEFCGGAHPSSGDSFETWLVATGEPLSLPDAFTEELTGKLIVSLGKKQDPGLSGRLVGECAEEYDRAENWGIAVVKAGVLFQTQFPHVIQACDVDVTLPWSAVKKFAKPSGPLARAFETPNP